MDGSVACVAVVDGQGLGFGTAKILVGAEHGGFSMKNGKNRQSICAKNRKDKVSGKGMKML